MSTTSHGDARLNFRLASSSKRAIEEAAAQLGQSVSQFAISTLVQTAERVIERKSVTELSRRDRDLFIAIIDDTDAEPNSALKKAARRYIEQFGKKEISARPVPSESTKRRRRPRH